MVEPNGSSQDGPLPRNLVISYRADINPSAALAPALQITTDLPADCSQQELDSVLDKIRAAVARQRKLGELWGLVTDLANHEQLLDSAVKSSMELDAQIEARQQSYSDSGGSRKDKPLTVDERNKIRDYQKSIEVRRESISMIKMRIEAIRQEMAL
jgi:hypothetical protein